MRMVDVVEAEAAFDAKTVAVGRAIAALGIDHLLVLDLIGHLATNAAERAERIHLLVGIDDTGLRLVQHHGRHQRSGRTGLHAFAAGDAGGLAHGIVEIEHDFRAVAAIGHADDVVDLDLAAGAHAQAALDAGIKIDAHRRMAGVGRPTLCGGEAALGDPSGFGPVPEFGLRIVRGLARRLIGDQQLHDHFLRGNSARALGLHLHADRWRALAGRREHTLALDLDHAGAAIAVGAIVGRGRIAQMRNLAALTFCNLPDRLACIGLDLLAVELERNLRHSAASLNSSGKYLITVDSGFDAACPSPQIEASRIAWLNSSRRARFQTGCCISSAAFWVPTRHGVHWPQLSSSKNFIRFNAAARTLSFCDRITIAAEPMKQPYFSSVPKSSGISSIDAGRMPPEAPPGRYAWKVCPSAMPPQNSSISSRTVTPAGASFMPGFLTRPDTE